MVGLSLSSLRSIANRTLYDTVGTNRLPPRRTLILSLDPYRIDDIDIFSNTLYVREKILKLAHEFLELDKDRPEVCFLFGGLSFILPSPHIITHILTIPHSVNHYSMRAEHEKAIKYFRRATSTGRTSRRGR
jgi:anaphase-promoting complex subunit 8